MVANALLPGTTRRPLEHTYRIVGKRVLRDCPPFPFLLLSTFLVEITIISFSLDSIDTISDTIS